MFCGYTGNKTKKSASKPVKSMLTAVPTRSILSGNILGTSGNKLAKSGNKLVEN